VRQSILEDHHGFKILYLSGSLSISNFPKRPGFAFEVPRNCLASYARNCISVTGVNGYVRRLPSPLRGRARAIELFSQITMQAPRRCHWKAMLSRPA